jgi:hypothetical protein
VLVGYSTLGNQWAAIPTPLLSQLNQQAIAGMRKCRDIHPRATYILLYALAGQCRTSGRGSVDRWAG